MILGVVTGGGQARFHRGYEREVRGRGQGRKSDKLYGYLLGGGLRGMIQGEVSGGGFWGRPQEGVSGGGLRGRLQEDVTGGGYVELIYF